MEKRKTDHIVQHIPFDIASLHRAYADGLAPKDVIAEVYRRIEAIDDPGIFLHLIDQDDALAATTELGAFDPTSKPLWGIPFVIKDNIDTAGAPTTAACPDYAYEAEQDSFVVAQLRNAGAILIGKTNLDQFATGLVGVRTPFPVPKNALDPEIVPGGSSSGSGVAVSHGIVSFALGTDTAGSGRVPAALNNIVGLKPTLGALSNTGVVPACLSLDTVSIFALTVSDAYCVFRAAAVFDENDSYARPINPPPLRPAMKTFKVGIPTQSSRAFFNDDAQSDSFDATLALISQLGGELVEIDFQPFYDVAKMLYEGVWVAERYAVIAHMMNQTPDPLHPATRRVIEVAENFDAVDTFNAFYALQKMKRHLAPVIAGVDMMCVPTIPTFATVTELEKDPIGPNSRLGTYTNFVNLLDLCGIAVPVATRDDGRPGSVTLLAPAGEDHRIAAVAASLHAACDVTLGATDWKLPTLEIEQDNIAADEIAIAVVGAHMSGLPLNGDLTSRGARFVRAGRTAGNYKLFSLPGGPPMRPGLIRSDAGAAIDLEVWAMPKARFGDFMCTIPAPLGIGTLTLEDGSTVNGFICEPFAVRDAEDITGFGGWRAYIEETPKQTAQH